MCREGPPLQGQGSLVLRAAERAQSRGTSKAAGKQLRTSSLSSDSDPAILRAASTQGLHSICKATGLIPRLRCRCAGHGQAWRGIRGPQTGLPGNRSPHPSRQTPRLHTVPCSWGLSSFRRHPHHAGEGTGLGVCLHGGVALVFGNSEST